MTGAPARREGGFTLTEMMVVVIIIGVLAAVAVFGARRSIADTQLAAAANNFRWALNSAHQRAVATHNVFLVEMQNDAQHGFRFCAMLPPQTAPTCDPAKEASRWTGLGDQVRLWGWTAYTQLTGASGTAFGSGPVRLLVLPQGGVVGNPADAKVDGFTLFLGNADRSKVRKVYVFGLTGQSRVVDSW